MSSSKLAADIPFGSFAQKRWNLLQAELQRFYPQHSACFVTPPTLLVVSKNRSFEQICSYYDAGARCFGENRVHELAEKAQMAAKHQLLDIQWHFIGPLQTNKLNKLLSIPRLCAVHSVDSQSHLLGLLDKIARAPLWQDTSTNDHDRPMLDIFLQRCLTHEVEKSGIRSYQELVEVITLAQQRIGEHKLPLRIRGLMTMATWRTESPREEAIRCFSELRKERDQLHQDKVIPDLLELSMGMAQDYRYALDKGSSILRLGRIFFEKEIPLHH